MVNLIIRKYVIKINGVLQLIEVLECMMVPMQMEKNPFEQGTARMARTTPNERNLSKIIYQPLFTEEGRYAVYVSYQSYLKALMMHNILFVIEDNVPCLV